MSVTFSQSTSPDDFLGYQLGEKFTRHHRVVDYLELVAQEHTHFQLINYGETTEDRPLMGLIMSSEENMGNINSILSENVRRVNEGIDSGSRIPIVYLSYNVHGNEAVGTEAAMRTIGSLTNENKDLLEKCIVIIDPCVNPDGRDRYVHFQDRTSGPTPNTSSASWEHREPWPGGRSNHYMFDMNRDLAWQTQKETKARTAFYRTIMPHVHVDYHEQGINNPYYFAPAAEPLHKIITPWQRECQEHIGGFNARGFDARGALYFTREIFDLFYPSYGDTWPMFQGAIGMTYEQAGSGRAGREITIATGDKLTLSYRIENHHSTAISTINAAIHHRDRLLKEFAAYHRRNIEEPWGDYMAYLIPLIGNDASKIFWLTDILDKQGITYSTALASNKSVNALDYSTLNSIKVKPLKGDLVIDAHQPSSALLQVLFDPDPELSDSLTYDITTWALPFAYGLHCYALEKSIPISDGFKIAKVEDQTKSESTTPPYAWIINYNTDSGTPLLAELLNMGTTLRVADAPFVNSGEKFSAGSVIVTRRENEKLLPEITELLNNVATTNTGIRIVRALSGLSDEGADLGSGHFQFIKAPKIAVLSGSEVSSLSFGEILYTFETVYKYPINVISDRNRMDLENYDVIIIPRSWIRFSEDELEELQGWVSSGGNLISIGGSCRNFADKNGWGLTKYSGEMDESSRETEYDAHSKQDRFAPFALNERMSIMDDIPGAVYSIKLDSTHPLAFGYSNNYMSIKTSSMRFAPLENGYNIGVLHGKASPLSGFAGIRANENLDNSLSFGVKSIGSGSAIYLIDNVLFRGFWKNGHKIFSNAVFLGPMM